jgi:hypothetical protein
MVAIIGTIIALVLCLMFGQFSFALLLSGILCLVGIMIRTVQQMACFIFITAISSSLMVASDMDWFFLVPPLMLWLTKEAITEYAIPKHLWLILLPIALFSLNFQDRDLKAVILVLFVLTLPTAIGTRFFTHAVGAYFKHGLAALILLISGVVFLVFSMPRYTGKVAIIEAGVWARTEKQLADVNDLNIESAYSYSEFKKLLGAEVIRPVAIDESYAEAWLITPTQPLDTQSVNKLWNWVKNGGRLIIVTDHTDIFGHARVVNAFLLNRKIQTSLTAFFPLDTSMKAEANWGESAWLKTTNVQSGLFMWPQFSARWVNESADYSNRNFFGPLSLTADDRLGRRVISGTTSFGKGRVVLFGDSTSFANFALYQPHIIPLIERIRSGSSFACMVPVIWIIIILSFTSLFFTKEFNMVLIIPILGLLVFFDQSRIPVEWKNYAYWTGDEKAIMEFGTPGDRLSTIYAVSILSGQKPRWVSSYDHHMGGFWVSKTSPPNNNWRWIDNSDADVRVESYDNRLEPLLSRVSQGKPYLWPLQIDSNHIKVGGIWTDDAVGNWWFDRGISKAKQKRIQAWIAWLSNQVPPLYPVPVSVKTNKLKEYKLRIDGRDWESVVIPELPLRQNEEIYLGRGVSAALVNVEDQPVFLGTRAFTEAWDCVNAWVMVPNLSEKSEPNVIK